MKLWGGRFTKETNKLVEAFNGSIAIDKALYKEDIQGSIAHSKMLGSCGIITAADALTIEEGLKGILKEIEEGKIEFSLEAEDIHMNIENLLIGRIGDVGKKLHTARSRNDQVALDIRLYLKKEMKEIIKLLVKLLEVLLKVAEDNLEVIMPGYTHLQRAQPIYFSYHMMAYFEMFKRDVERLEDSFKRVDVMPLGSGALAGTTYPINREYVAKELAFHAISNNAMDAVSDRDFIIEFIGASSIIMMHLSRFCEEVILWSTKEFSFIELDDGFSTGSSIMPQKKNPDIAELIRGKCGSVYGSLITILTMMKGLPLAYNKDMQEDKEPLFKTVDTVKMSLEIFAMMLATTRINRIAMEEATKEGFMNATDVADYMVKKGVPFRVAHETVGKIVLSCLSSNKRIEELNLQELRSFHDCFHEDLLNAITIKGCIEGKQSKGSTSLKSIQEMIGIGKKLLEKHSNGV